ncbi:MAG: hypothetical protein HC896_01090 [Bacteroidales bacterium]|nr:hypothetical protein [Bacteroidales bacterium]
MKEAPKVNSKALYSAKKNKEGSTSQGDSKNPFGNQGQADGDGDNTGTSQGLSAGAGGVSFSLSGRSPQFLPKPEFTQQEQGVVVVGNYR